MSLAPASSLGAFLKARLAVNGIQCAARSFGTLTAAGRWLLSSMGASLRVSGVVAAPKLPASPGHGNVVPRDICARSGGFEIGCADPEYFAFGILGVEPEQRQLRIGGFQQFAAAADLAQQPALRCQMLTGLVEDAPDDIEPVGAAVEGKFRLGPALARQRRHA